MNKNTAHYLFGTNRAALLAALFLRPEQGLHLRELERITGISPGSLHRELAALTSLGLLGRRTIGKQVSYAPNTAHPIHDELADLLRKTLGPVDVVANALKPYSERILAAFVYGSIASGNETADSDIDVMVVGDLGFAEAIHILAPCHASLGREVNVTVMKPEEFVRKREAGDGFTTAVWKGEKLWALGSADELG